MVKIQGWTFHHCGTIENVTGCIVTENELYFNVHIHVIVTVYTRNCALTGEGNQTPMHASPYCNWLVVHAPKR